MNIGELKRTKFICAKKKNKKKKKTELIRTNLSQVDTFFPFQLSQFCLKAILITVPLEFVNN